MASQLPPDPYAELGVAKDAKLPEIRSAYRKLVLKHHPDKVRDDTSKSLAEKIDAFQKVQQAYELLSDDNRRMRYDEEVKLFELRKEMGRFPRQPRTNLFAYEERKPKEEELPSRLWNIFDEYAYPRSTRTEERRREERRDERQREERRRERRAEEIRATKSYLFSPASREERRKERRREERRDERQREESRRERQAEEIRATKSYLFSPANREERRKERPERDERVPSSAYVEVETVSREIERIWDT
jgi:curved DNA-binding protein CbpA